MFVFRNRGLTLPARQIFILTIEMKTMPPAICDHARTETQYLELTPRCDLRVVRCLDCSAILSQTPYAPLAEPEPHPHDGESVAPQPEVI